MLTFLRKIRKSLIESVSTRKYILYAIGEIALVVIGILIALQINNWNEAQKSLKKEIQIYKELHSELDETLRDVKGDIGDLERNFNETLKFRDMILKNQFKRDSVLQQALYGTLDLEQPTPKTSAFESLKSIGLDILSNDSLRQEITSLYQLSIPILKNSESAVEFSIIRRNLSLLLNPYLKINRTKVLEERERGEIGFGTTRFMEVQNLEDLVNDELLFLTLQRMLNLRMSITRQHTRVSKRIERAMLKIEEEIERLD